MTIHPDIERVALIGWHVYPASRRTKAACIKNPTWSATADLEQIERWHREFPGCNWRVVMGPSKVWALDVDIPPGHAHDGVANLKALCEANGGLPPRPTERTGGGGLALFFAHSDEKIIGDTGHPALGIDPRRGAQSQMIPPSLHVRTGQAYRWLVPPWEVSPPAAPGWLLAKVRPPALPPLKRPIADSTDRARQRLYRAAQKVANAQAGHRNDTLNKQAYFVGRLIGAGMVGSLEAAESLIGAGLHAGMDRLEVQATVRSGLKSGMAHPWEEPRHAG